jgi:uncharacterized NAD(P)/FAD-binding protein YdhS
MSAFPDEPGHFWNWLTANNLDTGLGCGGDFCFIPREIYGRYLGSLLQTHRVGCSPRQQLHVLRGECVSLRPTRLGVEVKLTDGSSHVGHIAVLATGTKRRRMPTDPAARVRGANRRNQASPRMTRSSSWGAASPWSTASCRCCAPCIEARSPPFRGEACCRSRIAPSNRPRSTAPTRPSAPDISYVLRWLRRVIAHDLVPGQDWRSAIDALRPFTRDIWQSWSEPARRRFLHHARAWWDVHRHRTAPEINLRLHATITSGQVDIIAGKVSKITVQRHGATVSYRRRFRTELESMSVTKVVECVGIAVAPRDRANPVLQDLLEHGLIRPDPIGIGLDVTPDCAVIDRSGKPSAKLFAIGPLTRGKFWEIVAIPDIRVQCAELAQPIASRALLAAE